jgi:predicted GTPase
MAPVRILILGAAGRDFHNFNLAYRDEPSAELRTCRQRYRKE